MSFNQLFPYFFGAVFLLVLGSMVRGYLKHGGFKGMMFGATILRTTGEVEGAERSMLKTVLKVHALDDAPEKAIGLEFVAKSFASYQMMPFTMSVSEARKLVAHLQAAIQGR